jgi:hypothetical protein
VTLRLSKGRRSGFDRRLIDQHHRNVILDGIHTVTRVALERRPVFDQLYRRFARWTGKNLKKLRSDGHTENITLLVQKIRALPENAELLNFGTL